MKQTDMFLEIIIYCADQLLLNCTRLEEWLDDPAYSSIDCGVRCRMMLYSVDTWRIHLLQFNGEKTKSELTDKITELIAFYIEELTNRICNLANYIDKNVEIVNDKTAKSQCNKLKQTLLEFRDKMLEFMEEK